MEKEKQLEALNHFLYIMGTREGFAAGLFPACVGISVPYSDLAFFTSGLEKIFGSEVLVNNPTPIEFTTTEVMIRLSDMLAQFCSLQELVDAFPPSLLSRKEQ